MRQAIGVGDMWVTSDPGAVLITYALGPCLGVTAVDVAAGVGGLIHCQLPVVPAENREKARARPAMYVETGVPHLLDALLRLGAKKNTLVIKAAGAARILDDDGLFKIGERNYTVFRKIMWKNNLLIHAADVGGAEPRTMSLEVATGRVRLQSGGREWNL